MSVVKATLKLDHPILIDALRIAKEHYQTQDDQDAFHIAHDLSERILKSSDGPYRIVFK